MSNRNPRSDIEREDMVDDTSADSFPASDPPSFTPTTGARPDRHTITNACIRAGCELEGDHAHEDEDEEEVAQDSIAANSN